MIDAINMVHVISSLYYGVLHLTNLMTIENMSSHAGIFIINKFQVVGSFIIINQADIIA